MGIVIARIAGFPNTLGLFHGDRFRAWAPHEQILNFVQLMRLIRGNVETLRLDGCFPYQASARGNSGRALCATKVLHLVGNVGEGALELSAYLKDSVQRSVGIAQQPASFANGKLVDHGCDPTMFACAADVSIARVQVALIQVAAGDVAGKGVNL